MTRIRSAIDLVSDIPSGRDLVAFAGACGQRATGLWTNSEDAHLAAVLREALDGVWRTAVTGERAADDATAKLLDELHEDADFGDLHDERMSALVTVSHAAAAAAACGNDAAVSREATAAAEAEIGILRDSFYRRNGSYVGVMEDTSITRQLSWQKQDLANLVSIRSKDIAVEIRSRAAYAANLLRAGVVEGDWSGSPPGLEDPHLF